jgi:hypothetical protein
MQHRDLEEISANSKVCWAMTPQVLFVKPRDFVTYCQHWWTKDDTQIVINQACEHHNAPTTTEEGDGEICRAYALRGANCKLQNMKHNSPFSSKLDVINKIDQSCQGIQQIQTKQNSL